MEGNPLEEVAYLQEIRRVMKAGERVEKLLKISGAWAEFTGGTSRLEDLDAASKGASS